MTQGAAASVAGSSVSVPGLSCTGPTHTVVVDATYPKLLIAVAEKEAPFLAERANSSFLLLWRWHLAPAPAQQYCIHASLGGCHGLTPAGSSALHSRSLTPSQGDGGRDRKGKCEKTQEMT